MRSLLAILVTLAACNDHGAERLTKIKAKVCACKTASCAEQEMKLVPNDTIESTHRTQTIARDMLDCLAKLQADEQPTTDPDAEGSDEGSAARPRPVDPPTAAPPTAAPPTAAPPTAAPPTAAPPTAAPPTAAPPPARAPRAVDPAPAKQS